MNELMLDLPLEGSRLRMRAFVKVDITPEYIGWLNDPDVVRYSNQRFCESTEESCHSYLSSFSGAPNLFLAIEERVSGHMIGTMTVYWFAPHRTADIGIMIGDKSVWGQHYGYEAFSLLVNELLSSGSVRKLTAGTMACNVGMVGVLKRSGMRWEATHRDQELLEGNPVDILYYAKFQND